MDQGEVMRLTALSERQLFIDDLKNDYGLAPVEAEVLYDRITTFSQLSHPDSRANNQIIVTAVKKGEPAGKPIKYCKKIGVLITIIHPDDLSVRRRYGIIAERQARLLRICEEAMQQDAVLTLEQLAHLLGTSKSTIKRAKQHLLASEITLPTRGEIESIGPCQTHKAKAVACLLKGFSLEDTARRLVHSPESIARYWDAFGAVAYLHEKGFSPLTIRKLVNLSERVVTEYVGLVEQTIENGSSEQLRQVTARYRDLDELRKKGGLAKAVHRKRRGLPLRVRRRLAR
jgi:hypothetical protein